MADIKQVVVLMMENRSFDQYFGMFPNVRGIFDSSPAIPQPWPSQPDQILFPFRASTFTMQGLWGPTLGHDWNTMHAAANVTTNGSADNLGFYKSSADRPAAMSYYAQNDIPYHWALARTFALCDNYFCSALAGTGTNRMYLVAGTIDPQPTLSGNVYIFSPATANWIWNEPPANGPPPPLNEQAPIIGNIHSITNTTVDFQNPATMVPATAWVQVPWGSYLRDLRDSPQWKNGSVTYAVYDDWNWMPAWTNNAFNQIWPTVPGGFRNNDLNIFSCYSDPYGIRGDAFYKETVSNSQSSNYDPTALLNFEIDAKNGALPTVSWIIPPFLASEWPPFTTADGGYYMSRIVDAVINSPQWESTVLIITYDETNAHFDHVVPPISPNPQQSTVPNFSYEPWVSDPGGTNDSAYPNTPDPDNPVPQGLPANATQLAADLAAEPALPMGAGMRVATIIVSPWTYQAGIISDQLDHTSILQLIESVTGVASSTLPQQSAPPNLGWRRATFGNLYNTIQNTGIGPVPNTDIDRTQLSGVPTQDVALAWQTNAWNRYNAASLVAVGPPPNWNAMWPEVQVQSCAAAASNFTGREVLAAIGADGTATLSNRFVVYVYGFEPDEFIDVNAGSPVGIPANPNPPMVNPNPTSSTSPSVNLKQATRIPAVISVSGLNSPNEITFQCTYLNVDPAQPVPAPVPGVALEVAFYFDVTFNTPSSTFSFRNGTSRILEVQVAFVVDTTVTTTVNVYLTGGSRIIEPEDSCVLLAAEIYEAELAVTAAKNALSGEGYAATLIAAEQRLGVLQNTYAMYCGPGGSGGPPAPGGSSGLGGLGPGSIVQVPPSAFDPAFGAGPPAPGEEGSGEDR